MPLDSSVDNAHIESSSDQPILQCNKLNVNFLHFLLKARTINFLHKMLPKKKKRKFSIVYGPNFKIKKMRS